MLDLLAVVGLGVLAILPILVYMIDRWGFEGGARKD